MVLLSRHVSLVCGVMCQVEFYAVQMSCNHTPYQMNSIWQKLGFQRIRGLA